MKQLLVALEDEDHELVARYASAMGLPTIEMGAARIIAEWAGRQRIRDQARAQAKRLSNLTGPRKRKTPPQG